MAIAFGGIGPVNTNQTYASLAVSGSNTVGFVWVNGDVGSDDITGVTWGGAPMTKIAAIFPGGDRAHSLWWIANPSSGGTIAFTGGSFWRSVAWYYTGAKQTGQPDSSNTGTLTGAAGISVATTVAATNCWGIMAQCDITGNQAYTPSGVLASTRYDTDAGGMAIADSNGTISTGSQTGTLTAASSGATHSAVMISLAPAVAAGTIHSLGTLGVGA